MRIALVAGVFDLFHIGHLRILEQASRLSDKVVVSVNGDDLTALYKRRPIIEEESRLAIVSACRYVDHAIISKTFDLRAVAREYNVTMIIHGDDWERADYLRQIGVTEGFLTENKIDLVTVPYTQGVSTTGIIAQCTSAHRSARMHQPVSRPA